MSRKRTFRGGYLFTRFDGQPLDELVSLDIPPRAIVPLSRGFGGAPDLQVEVGDQVTAGQIIARDDTRICSPVHASLSGTVTGIITMDYLGREEEMVLIEGDGRETVRLLNGHTEQWQKLPVESIEELLYLSGVTALGNSGIPSRYRSSVIGPDDVDDIIVRWTRSEPYNLSLDMLLAGEGLDSFIEGIKILKSVMPRARVHLAVAEHKRDLLRQLAGLTEGLDFCLVVPVESRYPLGFDQMLVPTILDRPFPHGYLAANVRTIVLDVPAVLHARTAVVKGQPLIERTVALCGPGFTKPLHVRVRVGTPLERILDGRLTANPLRVVTNSLLSGEMVTDYSQPLNRCVNQVIAIPEAREGTFLAFIRPGLESDSFTRSFTSWYLRTKRKPDTNLRGEERPCIQCGYCLAVCPVRIVPVHLCRMARRRIDEKLIRYGILSCIDCNLCSYVCPSKIPLARDLRQTRARLTGIGLDHSLYILPKFDLTGCIEHNEIGVLA